MGGLAADLLPWAQLAVVALFALLALVALARAPRTGPPGWWVAATFGSLALALVGVWVPDRLDAPQPAWLDEVSLILLLAFPYLLLRFTASFRSLTRWLEITAAVAAAVVVLATFVRDSLPDLGIPQAPWTNAYIPIALTYWMLVSLVTVVRLWQAGRGEPTVARRRMRLMSAATAVLAIALLLEVRLDDVSAVVQLSVLVAAMASAAIFGLGFHPPRAVRLSWSRPEEEHLQQGTMAVLRATTPEDIARELLPPTVRVVGGSGAALIEPAGRVVASYGAAPAIGTHLGRVTPGSPTGPAREIVPLGDDRGDLVVWTSPYTPFFGQEEVGRLRSMGAIASLALERCDLLEDERARRLTVEQAQQEAERARTEATRANTAKSEFLSRMSHELRTPLNAILGFGQLLETSTLAAEDLEGVKHILKAGRHLLALISDVLDLSRIEAGKLTISPEPVNTVELLNDTVALIQPLADNRSIRLTVDVAGCDAWVVTDRQRCRQILLNLLSNAVKYNHDGGSVTVHCARVTEKALRVSVRDSGPGIDPTRQARLFEPFDRLGAEGSGVEGTGLGLALSKQLAERLGGAIGVDSAPGEGSTFWIDLPVTERPADAKEPDLYAHTPPRTGDRTLLMVEDNLANLRVVEAMLRRRPGISVLPAMQGGLAIELANRHRPDVIVLDLHLPDLSGREVLHRLQADPRTRDIPVVIASADATPGRVRQLREDGAFEYITKPLDLGHFLAVVDAALEQGGKGDGEGLDELNDRRHPRSPSA